MPLLWLWRLALALAPALVCLPLLVLPPQALVLLVLRALRLQSSQVPALARALAWRQGQRQPQPLQRR
jgi:hypothetical protein